jgi:hypothetical protein
VINYDAERRKTDVDTYSSQRDIVGFANITLG